jgi:ABC-type branched-subunit amino acid transport system substrate-binding protein
VQVGLPDSAVRAIPKGAPVVIGYTTNKDISGFAGNLGLSGIATGDQTNQMTTMVKTINARGGILGHKIVLAPHDVNSVQATSNPDQVAAEACADWAEHHVFAAVNAGNAPALLSCLKKHGIITVGSMDVQATALVYGQGVYGPSAISVTRYIPAVVDRLVAQGFFTPWDTNAGGPSKVAPVKIGAQSFNDSEGREYVRVLKAALAKHGLTLTDVESHSTNLSENASSTQAAVLKFRADGITHVFNANVLFYKSADSQGYRPRYAVDDTIATPALLTQNASASQLHGSMGAGYLPTTEVENPPDVSPAATRCKKLMRDAGEDVSQSLVLTIVLNVCDALSFLEQTLTLGGVISAAGLQAGLAKLTHFESAVTYRSRVSPTLHDGGAGVRDFVYVDSCTCYRFPSTAIYPVP